MEYEKLAMMWSALVPGGLLEWSRRRRALRELQSRQQQEESALRLDDSNPVNRAKVALGAGDPDAALRYWREALERYPHFARTSRDTLEVLLGLRLFDEAEALMLEGQRRAPRDPFYANGYALVAEQHGDAAEAIRRWERVRKKFPGSWRGYVNGAMCLARTAKIEAAEALSQQAIKLFPREAPAWISSARIAEQRRDWPAALHLWEMVRDKFNNVSAILASPGVSKGWDGSKKRRRT